MSFQMCLMRFCFVVPLVAASCLPDAIPESARKDLVQGDEHYAVGLWVNNWPAGQVAVELVQIIIQEVLGFNAEQKGVGAGTPQGFYAIAGCAAPLSSSNPMCGGTTTYVHVNVEAWSGGYETLLAEMKAEMPSMAPKSLGSMGYDGLASVYLPEHIKEAAYKADAEALEYFRSYNASRKSPWRYFSSPRDVETSRLLPCGETTLMDSARMKEYVKITGDTAGVVVEGTMTRGRCFDSFFWYSPACRQDPATCVILFNGGNGWAMGEWMQKATAHNMPVALAVGSGWGNYTSLFLDYPSITYWWEPDPTFLAVNPSRIVFPTYDPAGWARGDASSQGENLDITKQVSQDLGRLAPDVEAMLSNLNIDLGTMKALLLDQLESQDGWPEVACRWLQANEPTWRTWIPDNSECSAGYGMFDEQDERFVSTRAEPSSIRCKPCPAGHASEVLLDDAGTTHVCTKCVPGTHQAAGSSLTCDPCAAGEFQDERGEATCKRCPIGWYQDEVGQEACKACPESSTTVGLGSLSISECGCKPNTINVLESVTSFQCVACSRGLACPLSSSITTLRDGQASLGEAYTPELVPGFFSTVKEPLSVWECRPKSMCPGGRPGDCGGLEGLPCSRCPDGQTLSNGSCQDCQAGAFVPALLVVLLGLAALVGAYYLLNNPVKTRASPFVAVLLSASFAVNILQVVAIFGMMTLQWSNEFQATSGALQIFMLDLQTFSPSCILGANPVNVFLLRCLIFPALALWLLVCYFASPLWKRAWNLHRVCNTVGTLFAAGFGTMSAVAMQPLMCYQHPNGQYSLLKHPDVLCGGAQHSSMLATGFALGALALAFFAACVYAAWRMLAWSQQGSSFLQACRFLHGNFRLSAWWFGLLPLIRGFGFAFAIVVATDLPAAQVAIASVLLQAYVIAQAVLQPWKARLINVMDTLLSTTLLLLIRTSMQEDREKEEQFAQVFTMCTLLFLCIGLAFMLLSSLTAMCVQWRGRDASPVLNMGKGIVVEEQMKALQHCAEALLVVAADEFQSGLKGLNAYDLEQLSNAIEILDDVLATNFSTKASRLRMAGISKVFRASLKPSPPLSPGEETNEQAANEERDEQSPDQEGELLPSQEVPGVEVVTSHQKMVTVEC